MTWQVVTVECQAVPACQLPAHLDTHMDDNLLVHGLAVLEECDRADLFSSELERRISHLVCNLCHEKCPDLEAWRLHCVTSHSSVPGYSPARLSSGLSPAPELFKARPGRSVGCPECGLMFSSEDEMRSHQVSQVRSVRLVCGQCGAHWEDLQAHLLSHHATDTICSICHGEVQDLMAHHHQQHQGFSSVIAETEVRCGGDGVTLQYFHTVLATNVRFLATEVKPEKSVKTESGIEIDPPVIKQEESLPKITCVIGSYSQGESKISSEEERNSYNKMCYEKLHNSLDGRNGLGRNCCEICGFVPYTKNKYREKQDHMAKLHFKERIDGLLPSSSPYVCPAELCQYRGKDRQDVQRHYTGKHNILKMWVDAFLKQQDTESLDSETNNLNTSGLEGTRSEWEMTFQEMELIAIQQEQNRKRSEKKKSFVDDIKSGIDFSNSYLTISKVSPGSILDSVVETPPSISLIRIPKTDTSEDSPASALLQSVAARASTSTLR